MTPEEEKAAQEKADKEKLEATGKGKDEKCTIAGLPEDFYSLPKDKQNELLTTLADKAKGVDEKESMIQRQGNELGDLRKFKKDLEPILAQLKKDGKTSEKTELEKLLDEGKGKYSPDDLTYINTLVKATSKEAIDDANKGTRKLISSVLTNLIDMSIAQDTEINSKIYGENKEEVKKEYDRFKDPGDINEMKSNLKEAYQKVEARIIAKAKAEGKVKHEANRDEAIGAIGGGLPDKGKKGQDTKSDEDTIGDKIVDAGKKSDGSVFG